MRQQRLSMNIFLTFCSHILLNFWVFLTIIMMLLMTVVSMFLMILFLQMIYIMRVAGHYFSEKQSNQKTYHHKQISKWKYLFVLAVLKPILQSICRLRQYMQQCNIYKQSTGKCASDHSQFGVTFKGLRSDWQSTNQTHNYKEKYHKHYFKQNSQQFCIHQQIISLYIQCKIAFKDLRSTLFTFQFNFFISHNFNLNFKFKMNMKKLIEQADFDNVQQISKRWKKQNNTKAPLIDQSASNLIDVLNQSQTHKQNFPDPNITKSNLHTSQKDFHSHQPHEVSQKKRQVIPQIIDQDTEHFRNRLQHLLNTFKTDAVSQFMSMKKSMLDYQKDTVKSDTQKYLNMYQQKHQQLLQTKQKLIQMTKQAQKKTIQCQLMSNHIAKLNQRVKITKYLSRPFALLYQNKQKQKMIKFKFLQAAKTDNKKTLCKAFNGWRNIFREAKDIKSKQLTEKTIQTEVNQIVGKFQKQMEMLKQQLNQALAKNQQFENNKHIMQQNLKKAFLRGVCAMNMEAMGVLDGDSNTQANNTHMNISNVENLPNMTMNHSMMNMTQKSNHVNSSTNIHNSSVLIGKIKSQSKEHKWKEAPIMGLEQETQYQEPRPILVKPSTEGKVIKIIDGKSSTMVNSSVSALTSGMDKKKNGINTNSSTTLNQTTKSMVSSRKKI